MNEVNNEDDRHKVYLAVDCFIPRVKIIRKDYSRSSFYHYNAATVRPSLGNADKRMYPMVYEALKACSSEEKSFEVLFNAPEEHWTVPPTTGNCNDGRVRVCIKSHLLKRLHFVCGYKLTINLHGYMYRSTFRSGQHIPLGVGNNCLVFNVNEDGTTNEKRIGMSAGLLGLFECSGTFTLSLEWYGPGPFLQGAVLTAQSLLWSDPDFKIIARKKKYYKCHSKILTELSPVFAAMLNSCMSEQTSREINMKDCEGSTVETFLRYAYEGSIHDAYTSSNTCFKLYLFGHKYQITELENATLKLFRGKTGNWFTTETALKLYCFISGLSTVNDLLEKVLNILDSHKEEVRGLEEFERLSTSFPSLKVAFTE